MILIFDLVGGFTDMLKDLTSIYNFTLKYKYNFTIRNATNRPIDNPNIFTSYSIDNLFDIKSFKYNQYYIEYNKIIDNINQHNTYDFYKYKIQDRLWKNYDFCSEDDVINCIVNTNYTYVLIGGSFWFYTRLYDFTQMVNIFKTLIPSQKIQQELNKNVINEKYNCIHYRYEDDWIPQLKKKV